MLLFALSLFSYSISVKVGCEDGVGQFNVECCGVLRGMRCRCL